jgi:hypothetical protein
LRGITDDSRLQKEDDMPGLTQLIWIAGALHIALIAANFALPKRIGCRENLRHVSPLIRQIFIVHWIYIVFVLMIFASLCLFFAQDLAGASRLGRFLSSAMAIFWLLRIPLQFFFYDSEARRQHRLGDVTYTVAISYLAAIFSIAALRVLR